LEGECFLAGSDAGACGEDWEIAKVLAHLQFSSSGTAGASADSNNAGACEGQHEDASVAVVCFTDPTLFPFEGGLRQYLLAGPLDRAILCSSVEFVSLA
jgi:hypothetical protein